MKPEIWVKARKLKGELEPSTFAAIARYKARSSYARGFRNTTNENLGLATSEGYFVFLKLALAYSSLEVLVSISEGSVPVVRNLRVSNAIAKGRFDTLLNLILETTSKRSRAKVEQAISNLKGPRSKYWDQNLFEFVGFCRHLMFHGAFSPAGAGINRSKILRELLLALAYDSLNAGDNLLEKVLNKRLRNQMSSKGKSKAGISSR